LKKRGGGNKREEITYDDVTTYELAGILVHFLEFVVLLIMYDSVTDNAFTLSLRL